MQLDGPRSGAKAAGVRAPVYRQTLRGNLAMGGSPMGCGPPHGGHWGGVFQRFQPMKCGTPPLIDGTPAITSNRQSDSLCPGQ